MVESLVLDGLQALGEACAQDDRRVYIEASFTIALVSGVADLSAQTAMLVEYISRVVYAEGDSDAEMVVCLLPNGTSRNALKLERLTLYLWAVREVDALYVGTGDIDTPDNDNLTITAPAIPTLANIRAVLHDDLVHTCMGIYQSAQAA